MTGGATVDGKTGGAIEALDAADATPAPVEAVRSTTGPRAALVLGARSFPTAGEAGPYGSLLSARRRGSSSASAAEANAVAPPVQAGARINL